MPLPNKIATRLRRVLLVDAVVWTPLYPAVDRLKDVRSWYARWLTHLPGLELAGISAEEDLLGKLRRGVDGVILSGSPRDAWSDDPTNQKLGEVIEYCRDAGIPLLGVCYGHQLLARTLGGLVKPHPGGLELGNTPVELTAEGQASKLYAGFPSRFEVLSSHADTVLELPPGCALTVKGQFTAIQGFHWRGQMHGVQFHPETDPEVLRFIWSTRRDTWRSKVTFDLDQRLDSLQPAPRVAALLQNFVNHCLPVVA